MHIRPFTGDNLLFSPLPELVRAHIVQTVKSVLQHAPLQGKTALARLKADLLQDSFPIQQDRVTEFLRSRYFSRLKPSLIGRVITILGKELILQPDPDLAKVPENLARSLLALLQTHPREFEQVVGSDISKFVSSANDERLWSVFGILGSDDRIWGWLDKPARIRSEALINGKGSLERGSVLREAYNVPALATILGQKYGTLDDDKKENFIASCPVPAVVDDAIRLFKESRGYRTVEERGRILILRVAKLMTPDHIRRTLGAALDNREIWDAVAIPEIMKRFYGLTTHHLGDTKKDWKLFLDELEKKSRASIGRTSKMSWRNNCRPGALPTSHSIRPRRIPPNRVE